MTMKQKRIYTKREKIVLLIAYAFIIALIILVVVVGAVAWTIGRLLA